MKAVINITIVLFVLLTSCQNSSKKTILYESESLKIKQLTKNTFIHISYLVTETYGKVPCNGLIFINNNEAIVFDTPTDNTTSAELIKWINTTLNCGIKTVVVNHYHIDCLGGLEEFHKQNISSHASNLTIELAKKHQKEVPKFGFEKSEIIEIGNQEIINTYYGEAHTKDNIISYIPSEKILFGGCAVKSIGAKKGNLNDANIDDWSNTLIQIKEGLTELKYVVPGHGKSGGIELLDYTINLFKY